MRDHAPLLENAFRLRPCEDSYDIEHIEGEIPRYVRGTYYLNGPARFRREGLRYRHWLDGDGMVCAMRFTERGVHFTSRYVRGTRFVVEEECGRPVFRGFGTSFPNDQMKRGIATESPFNVSVYPFAGKLLAFGEQSLPMELDPETLKTRGPFDFAGQLNEISPFAAHPKFDATTGEMFNFGVSFSQTEPCLNLYRFTARGDLIFRHRYRLPYPCSLHDFALTEHYAVFHLTPYLLRLDALRREGGTTLDALAWEPQRGGSIMVIERETGKEAATVPAGGGYSLHTINAFEEGKSLTVDTVEFERPLYDQYQVPDGLFIDVSEGRPVRLTFDVVSGLAKGRRELSYCLAPDFPSTAPEDRGRPYHHFWMLGISAAGRPGRKFFDQLAHADWTKGKVEDVYQAPPRHYLGGEPVFIGDSLRQEGVVICQLFDADAVTSSFGLFDAFAVAQGPTAVIRLKAPVHLGFHSTFLPLADVGIWRS